ncbi:MAG: type I-B CRISPR-associated endonuclease Cas1b [Candidatus Thorarchaeota archaeon]
MKRNLYLNTNGRLHRKESTIYYITREGRSIVPVEQVKAVFAVARISVTSGVISFFSQRGIPIHFFGYYGSYEGSFYPRKRFVSGYAVVNQVGAYLDDRRRQQIASSIVAACIANMRHFVRRYESRVVGLEGAVSDLKALEDEVTSDLSPSALMSIEGQAWITYYWALDRIIADYEMGARVRRPPNNPVNAMVSFGNGLLYAAVLTQIYHTQLDPSVSFLHEPLERRFSLALDLSEMFKPELVGGLIARLLNLGMISLDHFDQQLNYCLLNDIGRRIFLSEFDALLRRTHKHQRLKRHISNEFLLRLEAYKLLKHVCENVPYDAFRTDRGH